MQVGRCWRGKWDSNDQCIEHWHLFDIEVLYMASQKNEQRAQGGTQKVLCRLLEIYSHHRSSCLNGFYSIISIDLVGVTVNLNRSDHTVCLRCESLGKKLSNKVH